MTMMRYDYHRPRSLDEAYRLCEANPAASFIAGGTDVMVRIRSRTMRPPALISLRSISDLRGIDPDGTRIGAMTTIGELCEHPVVRETYPVLVEAGRRLGSAQIRNVATIGGNLCNASPCADMVPALLVLEARVRIESAEGRRELPLEQLFRGPGATCLARGEVMTAILLDPSAAQSRAVFKKKGRVRMDLALASVAVRLRAEEGVCRLVRVAAGSVAPTPLRLREVEALLVGRPVSQELLTSVQQLAAKSVAPITDQRATEDYRRQIVGVFVRRAVEELWEHGVRSGRKA
ncbi:MAG: xanthine dehydrogenase family protein subunit M [Pseudomonadota bacterium]